MNIASFSWEFKPFINGGLGRYIEYYTNHLIEHNHNIWAFACNTGDLQPKETKGNLVVYRPLNWFIKVAISLYLPGSVHIFLYNISSYITLRKLVRKQEIDIISIHDWLNCPAGVLCALTLKQPIVFHVHNTEFSMMAWNKKTIRGTITNFFERLMARLSSKIIVPSVEMFKLLEEQGWDSNKISVIPHGFKSDFAGIHTKTAVQNKFKQELYSKFNISYDDKILLFAGRITYSKGIYNLIKAMALIIKSNANVKLIVLGSGECEKKDALISELGLVKNIHSYNRFLSQEEVFQHYMISDICIFPSLYEPFGLVALEAMSLGKPVILGNGFPKILGGAADNSSAVFVDSTDPEKIAEEILFLLNNDKQAQILGEVARNYVKNNFNWDKSFNDTLSVYREAIVKTEKLRGDSK